MKNQELEKLKVKYAKFEKRIRETSKYMFCIFLPNKEGKNLYGYDVINPNVTCSKILKTLPCC